MREEQAPMSARRSSSRPWQGVCAAAPVLGTARRRGRRRVTRRPRRRGRSRMPRRLRRAATSRPSSVRPSSDASAAAQGSDVAAVVGCLSGCAGACNLDVEPGLIPANLAQLFPCMTHLFSVYDSPCNLGVGSYPFFFEKRTWIYL